MGWFKWVLISVVLLVVIGIAALVGGGIYATFYYLPDKMLNAALNNNSVSTALIEGDLTSGYTIEKIRAVDRNNEEVFSLDSFRFHYNGLWDMMMSSSIIIDEFILSNLYAKIPEPKEERHSRPAYHEESNIPSQVQSLQRQLMSQPDSQGFKEFSINNLDFSNILLEGDWLQMPIKVEKFKIDSLQFLPKENPKLKLIELRSNFLDFHLENKSTSADWTQAVEGFLKPAFFQTQKIKQDISFSLKPLPDHTKYYALELFGSAISLYSSKDAKLQLEFTSFSPENYFENAAALKDLSLSITLVDFLDADFEGPMVVSGGFTLDGVPYEVVPAPLIPELQGEQQKDAKNAPELEMLITAISKSSSGIEETVSLYLDSKSPGFFRVNKEKYGLAA